MKHPSRFFRKHCILPKSRRYLHRCTVRTVRTKQDFRFLIDDLHLSPAHITPTYIAFFLSLEEVGINRSMKITIKTIISLIPPASGKLLRLVFLSLTLACSEAEATDILYSTNEFRTLRFIVWCCLLRISALPRRDELCLLSLYHVSDRCPKLLFLVFSVYFHS